MLTNISAYHINLQSIECIVYLTKVTLVQHIGMLSVEGSSAKSCLYKDEASIMHIVC